MADQPIKSEDIISQDLFVDAIKQADLFLAKSAEIETQLKETLSASKDFINSIKIEGAESLKNQAKATDEATKSLKNLEAIQQAQIRTETAKINLLAASERATKAKIATEQAEIKAAQQKNKEIQVTTSVYDALRKKYNDLSRAQIELSVRGRENGVVFKSIQKEALELRAALDKAEQGAGRFQRNVGNYASGFNGLNNSVNQLTREMPAFANSVQTGFMAISNNLPIFFDELTKINKANKELIANGQPTVSAIKQLGAAIFSVGSILSIGVTLLTLYGKELVDFVVQIFEGEKALKSITEANEAYNKSLNKTREEIANVTIDLKVQAGVLTKIEADKIKNENNRRKDINEEKTNRLTRLKALREELGLNEKLEYENTKLLLINKELFEAKAVENVVKYAKGLEEVNKLSKEEISAINEKYNLQGKILQIDGKDGSEKDKVEKIKELIDLTDRIRKLNIEDGKNEKQRAIEMALFEEETAIREVKKINATQKQKQELIIAIQKDTFNKLADIEEKSNKERDSAIKDDFKKTIEARQKIVTDNSDYELFLIEEKYKKEKEKGENANKDELNRLQDLIIERKKLIIQQKADEEKIGKNNTEQLAIQNKANIDKDKLRKEDTDKAKKAQDTQLKEALDFSSKMLDAVAKAEQKLSDLRVAGFEKQISDSEKNIETQRRLAERGLQNTLIEEEARKVQLDRQKEEEKRAEIKRQKALAFFKLFSQYAERDPNTALAKALSETVIAEAIAGSFYTGTEGNKTLGDMLGRTGTKDGHLILADDNERIFNPDDTAKLGYLTNKEVADLAYKAQSGLLDTAKYGAIPNGSFSENAHNSALLMQTIALRKEVSEMKEAIINKPVTNFEFNQYGDFIKTQIENGFTKRTTYKQPKPRI